MKLSEIYMSRWSGIRALFPPDNNNMCGKMSWRAVSQLQKTHYIGVLYFTCSQQEIVIMQAGAALQDGQSRPKKKRKMQHNSASVYVGFFLLRYECVLYLSKDIFPTFNIPFFIKLVKAKVEEGWLSLKWKLWMYEGFLYYLSEN